jgi:hypothetical protein
MHMIMGTRPLTVLSMDLFCARKKHTLSVKVTDKNCLPAFRLSVISFLSLIMSIKKINTNSRIIRKNMSKKNFHWKYTDEIIQSVFPAITHRQKSFIGECGIDNKYFKTL